MNKTKPNPREQLLRVSDDARRIYCNTVALRSLLSELETPIVTRALGAECTGNNLWQTQNYRTSILPTLDERQPAVVAALAVLENSPEYIQAKAQIEPLLEAIAELEAAEADAAQKRAEAEQAHRDELARAEADALEKARKDPAVVRAAQALKSLIGG